MTARLARRDGYVITVTDTGSGIEPAVLPHIFDAFRQADGSASREHGGLGLGLAIVRQLVELHGGTVAARSEGGGRGATFEVRLPSEIAPAQESAAIAAADEPLPADTITPTMLNDVAVLVVDDEADARELLDATLSAYGARVTTVASAAEGRLALDRSLPDIVVSDIGMASEDGYAFMRDLRGRTPDGGGGLPAVALTAYASERDRDAALGAGFTAHVTKPFEPSQLARLIFRLTHGGAIR